MNDQNESLQESLNNGATLSTLSSEFSFYDGSNLEVEVSCKCGKQLENVFYISDKDNTVTIDKKHIDLVIEALLKIKFNIL